MVCKYSGYTWSILAGMILTGSARSIIVKLAYQSGFKAPMTITLLYLFGQSLSLFVYRIKKWLSNDYDVLDSINMDAIATEEHAHEHHQSNKHKQEASIELTAYSDGEDVNADLDEQELASAFEITNDQSRNCCQMLHDVENSLPSTAIEQLSSSQDTTITSMDSPSSSSQDTAITTSMPPSSVLFDMYISIRASLLFHNNDEMPNGSNTAITSICRKKRWAHHIPYYLRPAIPAVFNLLNSGLRWASLFYIDASVAEMLISGLELTLSVVAARVIRKRMVSRSRWVGVGIVAIGVVIIERANNWKQQQQQQSGDSTKANEDDHNQVTDNQNNVQHVTIGVILIILQSILSVLQDIGEEIFMQATTFPTMMMLGMEGLYGFGIGLVIYSTIGNKFCIEDIDDTMSMLTKNATLRWWLLGLSFLFLLTGIFNIKATEVTSAMTRNVWKNLRTVLVWIIALCILYLGNNSDYGEAWHEPQSLYILLGFS